MDPGVTAALAVGGATYGSYIFGWSPTGCEADCHCHDRRDLRRQHAEHACWRRRSCATLTWLKFGILALLVVWALVFRLGSWSHFVPFVAQRPGSTPLLPAVAGALVAAFYSFGGWWDVSKIAGEVKDPARTLPRALVLGVLGVVAAYVLVSGVFLYLVPLGERHLRPDLRRAGGSHPVRPDGREPAGRRGRDLCRGQHGGDDHALPARVLRHGARWRVPSRRGATASGLRNAGACHRHPGHHDFAADRAGRLRADHRLLPVRRRAVHRTHRHARCSSFGGAITSWRQSKLPAIPITPLAFLALVVLLLALTMLRAPRQALLGCAVVLAGTACVRASPPSHTWHRSVEDRADLEFLTPANLQRRYRIPSAFLLRFFCFALPLLCDGRLH